MPTSGRLQNEWVPDGELPHVFTLSLTKSTKRRRYTEQAPIDWHPWLAGMVVAAPHRGKGIGSQLVRALLIEAQRLRFDRVYFGTDGPRFYERLGAVVHHVPRDGFWFMHFDL